MVTGRGLPRRVLLVAGLTGGVVLLCLLSLALGALSVSPGRVAQTLAGDPPSRVVDNVVWSVRVPRTLFGLVAGAALGLSGTLMQALTRNPLADPGLLGVSAGSAFGVVLAVGVFGFGALYQYVWFAFGGAALASVVVFTLARTGRSGLTPVKLALAGIAMTALLNSLTSAIVVTDPDALNRYRFWAAGSLADLSGDVVVDILPFIVVGTVLALVCAPAVNSLALGEDVAASLGRRTGLIRIQGMVAIMLLTGATVAVIGPIVFLGLVVPQIARVLVQWAGRGPDHRWLLPLSALIAPGLLLAADIIGRMIIRPVEIQAGVLIAFIGGPFFIAMVRRRRLAEV
ncbi:FecCD family ABC transporter permease [Actinomadura madurae]|uniref:FecCD family ABC transporter permease n=1 Tax=Actinomadura madurae TaxID=1993 RepID=UPI000D96AB5E|nr:iron ABC transporter permease [Actinomadura madurae]SPT51411.1 Ferric enterobactin transport system permease protein fepD [Actinomadura madurae]